MQLQTYCMKPTGKRSKHKSKSVLGTTMSKKSLKKLSIHISKETKILKFNDFISKSKRNPWEGLYEVHKIHDNGTMLSQKGSLLERFNAN